MHVFMPLVARTSHPVDEQPKALRSLLIPSPDLKSADGTQCRSRLAAINLPPPRELLATGCIEILPRFGCTIPDTMHVQK